MAVAVVPFIVEEVVALAAAGSVYDALAYVVGCAALGNEAAQGALIAGATFTGTTAALAGGAVLGGIYRTAYELAGGDAKESTYHNVKKPVSSKGVVSGLHYVRRFGRIKRKKHYRRRFY